MLKISGNYRLGHKENARLLIPLISDLSFLKTIIFALNFLVCVNNIRATTEIVLAILYRNCPLRNRKKKFVVRSSFFSLNVVSFMCFSQKDSVRKMTMNYNNLKRYYSKYKCDGVALEIHLDRKLRWPLEGMNWKICAGKFEPRNSQ